MHLKDDDRGPSGGGACPTGCHDPRWDLDSFHWDLSSYLWNFCTGLFALSRAGDDKAIQFCLRPSNILSLPKLSPKGAVKCDHFLGSTGQPFPHEQEVWFQQRGASRRGRLSRFQLGGWKGGLGSLNRESFFPPHHRIKALCRLLWGLLFCCLSWSFDSFCLVSCLCSSSLYLLSRKVVWQKGKKDSH